MLLGDNGRIVGCGHEICAGKSTRVAVRPVTDRFGADCVEVIMHEPVQHNGIL